MSKKSPWVRAKSSSHPGRFYYFNKETRASTWALPEGFEDAEIPSLPPNVERVNKNRRGEVADVRRNERPLQNAWNQPASTADESGSAACSEKTSGDRVNGQKGHGVRIKAAGKTAKRQTEVKQATKQAMDETTDMEEAMEVERWGEEEEVAMDIDVSQEDIAEMKLVRRSLSSPLQLHIESFGIPADYVNDYSDKLYLVLDTNVLLSHLNFLEELKDYAIKGVGKPVLVIPWIVMQELDKHKSRGNDRLAGKARKAVRLLFSCFTSNHPRVRCQTMEETQTEVHNVSIANNDDRILHCCLLYQTKTQGHSGIVVLFSNDVNLCTKALGNSVKAADRTTLFKELRALVQAPSQAPPPTTTTAKPLSSKRGSVPLTLTLQPVGSSAPGHAPSHVVHMTSPPVTPFTPITPGSALPLQQAGGTTGLRRSKEVSQITTEVEEIVREALTIPLKQEMMSAFDHLWSTMIAKKPPWSLKDQLFLIDKHWIAVYGQVLQQHVRALSTQLFHSLRNRPGVMTVDEALLFARRALSLVQGFRGCKYCADSIHAAVSRLDLVTNRLQLMKQQPLLGGASSGGAHLSLQSPTTPSPHQQPPVALVSPMGPSPIVPLVSTTTAAIPPSSLPLLTPSSSSLSLKEKLTLVAQTPPTIPSRQLEWVLGLVHDSIVCSQSLVEETLGSSQASADRTNVCQFVRQVVELLSRIVSSLQSLLENNITIPRAHEFLTSVEFFLSQACQVNSPLTIDTFFELVTMKEQRELLERALRTFTNMLAQLQSIDASFDS